MLKQFRRDLEAAIGIGTLIVFIALILVASIAAAVILQTAYELENRAEQTGTDAVNSASGGMAVLSIVGRINSAGPEPVIDMIFFVIGVNAGSYGMNVNDVAIVYQDDNDYDDDIPDVNTTIVSKDNNNGILSRGELMNFTIDLSALSNGGLGSGESCVIKFIPPDRVPATWESFIAPWSLTDRFIELV